MVTKEVGHFSFSSQPGVSRPVVASIKFFMRVAKAGVRQ